MNTSTTTTKPPRKIRFEVRSGFGARFREAKKRTPAIKAMMTEFNLIKRRIPREELPAYFKDHTLKGLLKGIKECHLDNDVLLLYKQDGDTVTLLDVCDHRGITVGPKARSTKKRIAQ